MVMTLGLNQIQLLKLILHRLKQKLSFSFSLSAKILFFVIFPAMLLSGCGSTYPDDKIIESIRKICHDEYGIDNVEIKIKDKTLGVYLPLDKLFSEELEEMLAAGDVKDISSLLKISPDALEKVEDVLFSTSRVVLSTNKPLDFYVLKAVDAKLTGITLVLIGYVQDIRRVRFWDISRDEYRKRIYHDLQINQTVIWRRPVDGLLENLGKVGNQELLDQYFLPGTRPEDIPPFFNALMNEESQKEISSHKILELRAFGTRSSQALVYTKVMTDYVPLPESSKSDFVVPQGFEGEYLFSLTKYLGEFKISKVIPFSYLDDLGAVAHHDFPPGYELYNDLGDWIEEFELHPIHIEDFISSQVGRRILGELAEDERISNTFARYPLAIQFVETEPAILGEDTENFGYFQMRIDPVLKAFSPRESFKSYFAQEDFQYFLKIVLKEFSTVLRGYPFEGYDSLELIAGAEAVRINRDDLLQFSRSKMEVVDLLKKATQLY